MEGETSAPFPRPEYVELIKIQTCSSLELPGKLLNWNNVLYYPVHPN